MRDEGETRAVEVDRSQGVMAGNNNTQFNHYASKPPLTPATFAAWSAHAAAIRIREASHDDAVDLFASTPADVLGRKLKSLLLLDEDTIVAILADLDAEKVTDLVVPLADEFPWLEALPRAAEGIGQLEISLRWNHATGAGRLTRAAQRPEGAAGYFREYAQGRIYWNDDAHRTHAVHGQIAELYLASGGASGRLGLPRSSGVNIESPEGTLGTWQEFEGGFIASSDFGTQRVPMRIPLLPLAIGFPVTPVETRDGVERQRFEDVVIYWTESGPVQVRPLVAERAGDAWVPVSSEEQAGSHAVQRFKNSVGTEMAVYWYTADGTNAIRVTGRKLAFYDELGGPASWLGLPVATARAAGRNYVQRFEYGSVYSRSGQDLVAVPAETVLLAEDRLGWPMSTEKPVGDGGDDRIQFFERGLVTLRYGEREVWLPEPDPDESQANSEEWPDLGLTARSGQTRTKSA